LVYGENKDHEQGLSAYTHWLTALNMTEMKNAWDAYVQKDKNKFKPQFAFDDLATFDRALYNYISNPLVLRLFLETYHNKALPKKGNKHLNIWADWLATFIDSEQEFFRLLADAIWEKGENELLLDDVLKNENLKPYFTDDRINAPYPRLKNNGWISRYVKDLNVCVAFTVEGALLFIFGKQLQNRSKDISIELIDEIFLQGRKLQKAGLEAFLCEEAMRGELGLVTDLIDLGGDKLEISIRPLLHYLKAFGVEDTLSKLLEDTTENDWQALLKLNKMLDELQLQVLRKELLNNTIELIEFKSKYDTELGLIAILEIDDEKARYHFTKIDAETSFLKENVDLLFRLGKCEKRFARFDKAHEFYQKCLNIQLNTLGINNPEVASLYSAIGGVFDIRGDYDKALELYHKSIDIYLLTTDLESVALATMYNNIGLAWKSKGLYDQALEFTQKSLDIRLKILGEEHPSTARSYNSIGVVLNCREEFNKALIFYQKSLDILLRTLGDEHEDISSAYNNIGYVWDNIGDYDKALEFLNKTLEIDLKAFGEKHPYVGDTYNNLGRIWQSKGHYDKALEFYNKSLDIRFQLLGDQHPDFATSNFNIGYVLEKKGEHQKALEFFQKSYDIRLKYFGIDDIRTKESNTHIESLCALLNIEDELQQRLKKNEKI
jgi:tetratricopeptide (TPR) repeat protein